MVGKAARQLINWNAEVTIDGDKTTLHDWLGQNYKNMSDSDIARILKRNGITASGNAVRHHRRNHGWSKKSGQAYVVSIDTTVIESEEVEESASEAEALLLKAIKNKPQSVSELSEMLDRSESSISEMLEVLRDKSYNIVEAGEKHRLDTTSITSPPPLPQTLADQVGHHIRFGIASDLHTGSTAQQITNLRRFVRDAYEQGIRHIFVPGDLTAGVGVYRGQINDLYATSADTQLVALDWLLPKLDGLVYYVIGGNHDYCVDEDTQILTKRGWLSVSQLQKTDEVATLNPDSHAFEWQDLIGLYVNPDYKGEMLHFSHRGVDHLVTPDHDIYVQSRHTLEWRKKRAGSTWATNFYRCKKSADSWCGTSSLSVEIPRSMKREGCTLPIDRFAALVGWYVSEGHIDRHSRIALCQSPDSKHYSEIVGLVEQLGFEPKPKGNAIRFSHAPLAQFLEREFGNHSYMKRIPAWVKAWDKDLLEIMLLAYLRGDGTRHANGNGWTATTASDQLVDDLQEIAAKIGWKSNARERQEFPFGDTGYVGTARRISLIPDDQPSWLYKKPSRRHYAGTVWCPQVDNGIWLARRNGCIIWTGNSYVKLSGYNIVAAFAAMREDVVYLGFDMADVPITNQADVRLWHPSGGVPYSISYRLQKGMEQMTYAALTKAIETGENPRMRIVLSGHLHVSMTMQRGPIMGLQCGCFEGQTNYLKRKALFPQVGGYIIELWLTDGGLIQRVRHEWVPFLEIENDFLNYPDLLEQLHGGVKNSRAGVVPLFAWEDDS